MARSSGSYILVGTCMMGYGVIFYTRASLTALATVGTGALFTAFGVSNRRCNLYMNERERMFSRRDFGKMALAAGFRWRPQVRRRSIPVRRRARIGRNLQAFADRSLTACIDAVRM